MAAFYVDEDIPASLVNALAALGHDLLTALTDGQANRKIDDYALLMRATSLRRVVLTYNRRHFHAGMVTCTDDADRPALARRIDDAVRQLPTLEGQLVKVVRPSTP